MVAGEVALGRVLLRLLLLNLRWSDDREDMRVAPLKKGVSQVRGIAKILLSTNFAASVVC